MLRAYVPRLCRHAKLIKMTPVSSEPCSRSFRDRRGGWYDRPWILDDWRPRGIDKHNSFGDVFKVMENMARTFDPWHRYPVYVNRRADAATSVKYDNKIFKIQLDVSDYTPEEVKVKISDGIIVIHGEHEERKDDYGTISRSFTRQFNIPENVDQGTFTCSVADDGTLTVKGQVKQREGVEERELPIEREVKEEEKKDDK